MFPLLPFFSLNGLPAESDSINVIGNAIVAFDGESALDVIQGFAMKTNLSVDLETKEISESVITNLITLFNNGVRSVFVCPEQARDIVAKIPNARLTIKVKSPKELDSEFENFDIQTESPTDFPKNEERLVFVKIADVEKATDLVAAGYIPVVDSDKLTTEGAKDKLSVSDVFIAGLNTDRPDGLYTTMVTDVNNQSLGLVYSSKESISEAIRTKTGVYQSRKHGLWYKGATSGATQTLFLLERDCDGDCVKFIVSQAGPGFCHLNRPTCFGGINGLFSLEKTLKDRLVNAPEGSYSKRLFDDEKLLSAKIQEEADELVEASSSSDISWEAADLFYFALAKCVKNGVSLEDVARNLELKSLKVTRRKGDAKEKYLPKEETESKKEESKQSETANDNSLIVMNRINCSTSSEEEIEASLARPVQKTSDIMKLVNPIVDQVRTQGDKALLELTAKFDKVQLSSSVVKAPFSPELMKIPENVKKAIDLSISNVEKFHTAQLQTDIMTVETCEGVKCSRFARPIETVGLYIPGGTAVLPSTSLMLGVPAKVAGCKEIVFASPPRKDGTISPEVVYVADKVGASMIVLSGGAQAVAAMAYGTETVPKCDKIMGPGNQFVTAAKMYVQNDTTALCSIDMPAGPSEVLVIADKSADPDFVASDLLSQAEHGVDSQVILIAVSLTTQELDLIDEALHRQALALSRVDIVRKCIKHSSTLLVNSVDEAFDMSNRYAPEHLILQLENASSYLEKVENAGSVFVGAYSPESCGDYSSGTNHTLPTYGYAKQYSGVNTATFQKFITSQDVTPQGLKTIGQAVMDLAEVEGLDAHGNAVRVRMEKLGLL